MTKYEEIHHRAFQLLETELPSFLTYHSPLHTAYVMEQAEMIAAHEQIDSQELLLIKIASMLHDIGFIQQYKNHEEAGTAEQQSQEQQYINDKTKHQDLVGV